MRTTLQIIFGFLAVPFVLVAMALVLGKCGPLASAEEVVEDRTAQLERACVWYEIDNLLDRQIEWYSNDDYLSHLWQPDIAIVYLPVDEFVTAQAAYIGNRSEYMSEVNSYGHWSVSYFRSHYPRMLLSDMVSCFISVEIDPQLEEVMERD